MGIIKKKHIYRYTQLQDLLCKLHTNEVLSMYLTTQENVNQDGFTIGNNDVCHSMQIIPLMNVTSCAVMVPVWNLMTYAMEKMIARTSLTKIYVVSLHDVQSRENSIQNIQYLSAFRAINIVTFPRGKFISNLLS